MHVCGEISAHAASGHVSHFVAAAVIDRSHLSSHIPTPMLLLHPLLVFGLIGHSISNPALVLWRDVKKNIYVYVYIYIYIYM